MVAVSGGADSTALLHLVCRTRDRHRHPVFAAHVNHAVRPDADQEEERLREMCERLGVVFLSKRIPKGEQARSRVGEAELRTERYGILRHLVDENEIPCWILLGHQRDDQAETVLFRLVRGAGLPGLAGIRRRRGLFLRPLLETSHDELCGYLDSIDVPWVEDPTNRDLRYARNRIRHSLLPWIESELRPNARSAIARASSHIATALDFLDREAMRALRQCRLPAPKGELRLDRRQIESYPDGLVEHLLRQAVARLRRSTRDIPASTWRTIHDLHRRGAAGQVTLPSGCRVEVTQRMIRIVRTTDATPPIGSIEVPLAGTIRFPGFGSVRSEVFAFDRAPAGLTLRGLRRLQAFDADQIRPPVRLRPPSPGDRIRIGVESGTRKVAELLAEGAVPRDLRPRQPILEDQEGILWIPGIRRAERARVGPATERIWLIRISGRMPVESASIGGETRQ